MYPMKKKRKRTTDKTPVRRTRQNWDAESPMAVSMLGTPSPNNSSIDADKDIVWDNCSPTQHLTLKRRKPGRTEISDIAQFIKVVPAENTVNVEKNLQPLLGIWMERGHECLTDKQITTQRKVKGRKTRSKIGHLKSDVFSSELGKLAKLMESKQESPVIKDKLKLSSSKHECQMSSEANRESTPINFKNKRKSLNTSNDLWGQDDWFDDESFLIQATQIEQDVCSQMYTEIDTEVLPKSANGTSKQKTKKEHPKANSQTQSHKTPLTRKTKRGKSLYKESKLKKTDMVKIDEDKTESDNMRTTIPTLPLKPRQLNGTFQNTLLVKSQEIDINPNVRIKSEEIDWKPTINSPSFEDDEVWDDLDDNELAGLDAVLDAGAGLSDNVDLQQFNNNLSNSQSITDTNTCKSVVEKVETLKLDNKGISESVTNSIEEKVARPKSNRRCFRFTASTQMESGRSDGRRSDDVNNHLALEKLCSPITRSMTRDKNNRNIEIDTTNNNMPHCSQEQIEKKRQLALQRRKQRKENVSNVKIK